nr:DUF551 domain-containing protein [uncultured Psychrobacter sp.]
MNNLPLQPLVWDWSYGDGGKTNAVCRAKSPSHEYIIRLEAGGDCYVDYRKFDNDEDSDNRKDEPPVFDSIKAAQEWVQFTHYPSKMQPYVKPAPTWIDVNERLPEKHTTVLVVYHAHFDDEPITEFDVCTAFFDGETFDPKDQLFYQKRNTTVTQWMPIPEFSTMQIFA